jgi:hypothetical protein
MNAVLSPLPRTCALETPRNEPHRGRPKSPELEAVEEVLRTGTLSNPLTVAQIAARSGVGLTLTRKKVNNCCQKGRAHNTNADGFPGLYAWGPVPVPVPARRPDHRSSSGYDGRELQPFTGRPGAMRAFELPSIQNGERVERARPCLIGMKPDGHYKGMR